MDASSANAAAMAGLASAMVQELVDFCGLKAMIVRLYSKGTTVTPNKGGLSNAT